MIPGFRDTDEMNLWNQWVTTFSTRLSAEESIKEADALLTEFREKMKAYNLIAKPGRA